MNIFHMIMELWVEHNYKQGGGGGGGGGEEGEVWNSI